MSAETTDALDVRFPDVAANPSQDNEWCEVTVDGDRRRIRFHDYDEIFSVPGLYEAIFHDHLECQSPTAVCDLLAEQVEAAGGDMAALSALDVGAGNGLVGEALQDAGVETLVGVDILVEARGAAARDRPGLYVDYLVCDLTALDGDERERLSAQRPDCLTTVAALGFDDIPPQAFATAYDLIAEDGTGFRRLISRMLGEGVLDECARREYVHRLSMSGEPLPYVAVVGRKRRDIPQGWLA